MKKRIKISLLTAALTMAMTMTAFAETLTFTIDTGDRNPFDDLPVFTVETHFTNSPSYGNLVKMDEKQRAETKAAIEVFMAEHINDDMTIFEKEMQIIKWLSSICEAEVGNGWENATAYSCIIQGKAQCAGYADAFLQTAKMCGINAYFIGNDAHGWNLVQLDDGHYYHVDVTWEDSSDAVGFEYLPNEYINLTDEQVKKIKDHETWTFTEHAAAGTMFGKEQVAEYLKTGSIGKRTEELSHYANYQKPGGEYDIGNADVIIDFKDIQTTVKEAADYINSRHSNGVKEANVYIRFPLDRFDPYVEANVFNANEIGMYDLMDIIDFIPFKGGGGAFFTVDDEVGRPTMFFRCQVTLD